ncbi:hypothetical protein P154DRAFT_283132 [Amniculicola lignicola CBS 123094]|uniref:Zn(2)-C6 fungal-type domain-containing protein n=1 Tax=Amniculicola lignicola CBS 123094 TaxID=1392246 RepID=A0A6A5W662_9PLEO|nr:hypothetical protein P154DRAFT_283132 [Amniculicola lignicola CBS 123094]
MASAHQYPNPDAQMSGGSGLYGNQNGGTPPAQQQQHVPTDEELQLQEGIAQHLQRNSELMHPGAAQAHQLNAAMNAHHQFHTPPRPTHSPQQMAQSVMSLEDHGAYDPDGSSRKRSKVSRACDECRRKKIRCDATSENGPEACSSCKRTGARCQFSRQPMKRGPSKGYIKELADRLNTLENQIQTPQAPGQTYDYLGVTEHGLPDAHAPPQFGRKRTHSMSEGLQDMYAASGRPSWPAQDREYPNGSNLNLQRRTSYGDLAASLIAGSNEGTVQAYYNTIHVALPILPHDSKSLNRLTDCPPKLREGVFLALECAIRSLNPLALPAPEMTPHQLIQKSSEIVDAAQHTLGDNDNSRQFYNGLVYCQSLIFLILASDKPGSSASGTTVELLGRLAGRISDLGLNDSKTLATLRDQNFDNFEAARRVFWCSFILDRFHASSRTKDTALPLYCGTVSRDDFNALGEGGYHLARAADIVGQMAFMARASNVPNSDTPSPYAFTAVTSTSPSAVYLNGQLSRFKESLDITNLARNTAPLLAYQYLRILVARLSTYMTSSETMGLCKDLLSNLSNGPTTPLHPVFASLLAALLIELSERVESQVDAMASIREMDEALLNGQILQRSIDGAGWDLAIRETLHQKTTPRAASAVPERTSPTAQPNMAGLQHLAAAAVGEREGADATRPTSSSGNGQLGQNSSSELSKPDMAAAMAAASEAAAAQATAAAAQKQLNESRNAGNGNGSPYDPSALVKEGFMAAL